MPKYGYREAQLSHRAFPKSELIFTHRLKEIRSLLCDLALQQPDSELALWNSNDPSDRGLALRYDNFLASLCCLDEFGQIRLGVMDCNLHGKIPFS
ncbi:hypothetical protein ASD01_21940 [Ensifer sp. Root423]|nr:hypothetical protein ASD01_21940 [Ensifer sp. Root423]